LGDKGVSTGSGSDRVTISATAEMVRSRPGRYRSRYWLPDSLPYRPHYETKHALPRNNQSTAGGGWTVSICDDLS